MRQRRCSWVLGFTGCAALSAACLSCSSDGDPAGGAGTGGNAGSGGTGGSSGGAGASGASGADAGGPRPLRVRVVTPVSRYSHPHEPDKLVGLSDARVIVNVGEAGEVERAVDAQGIAEFPEIDPMHDTYSVLAYAPGRGALLELGVNATTRLHISPSAVLDPSVDLLLALTTFEATGTGVTVSGSITGKAATENPVWVAPSVRGISAGTAANNYTLQAWTDSAFSLDVFQYTPLVSVPRGYTRTMVGAYRFDLPTPTGPVTFDLDLAAATPLPVTHITGSLSVPGGEAGAFAGSTAGLWYQNRVSAGIDNLGMAVSIAPNADGSAIDIALDLVAARAAADPARRVSAAATSPTPGSPTAVCRTAGSRTPAPMPARRATPRSWRRKTSQPGSRAWTS